MKVFVTGGSGFIGRALCGALVARGDKVVVLSRNMNLHIPGVEVLVGDVLGWGLVLPLMLQDVDVVINCMGETRVEEQMYSLHVKGTKKLIDNFLLHSRKSGRHIHFIQLSSVGAYGMASRSSGKQITIDERCTPFPVGQYEVSKTVADELVMGSCSTDSTMSFTILRPTNVIGDEMSNQSFYQLANMVRRGLFFYIGDFNSVANYIHVNDVVGAVLHCTSDARAKGKVYIISNDCPLQEVVDAIARYYKVRVPFLRLPEWVARLSVTIFPPVFKLPLTKGRVDALVSKVNYSSELIKAELGFDFSFDIPASVPSVLAKKR